MRRLTFSILVISSAMPPHIQMCNLAAQTQQQVLVFVQKSPWGGVQEQQAASIADQHRDQENIEARCDP